MKFDWNFSKINVLVCVVLYLHDTYNKNFTSDMRNDTHATLTHAIATILFVPYLDYPILSSQFNPSTMVLDPKLTLMLWILYYYYYYCSDTRIIVRGINICI